MPARKCECQETDRSRWAASRWTDRQTGGAWCEWRWRRDSLLRLLLLSSTLPLRAPLITHVRIPFRPPHRYTWPRTRANNLNPPPTLSPVRAWRRSSGSQARSLPAVNRPAEPVRDLPRIRTDGPMAGWGRARHSEEPGPCLAWCSVVSFSFFPFFFPLSFSFSSFLWRASCRGTPESGRLSRLDRAGCRGVTARRRRLV